MKEKKQYKHLSLEERKEIEAFLNNPGVKLKTIAAMMGRSEKSIREEIVRHRTFRIRSNQHNKCGKQNECNKHRLCTHCIFGLCKHCKHDNCNELCDEFISTPVCPRTARFPFVCSGCDKIERCPLPKYFYNASTAQADYEKDKREWRYGVRKSPEDMEKIVKAFQTRIRENNNSVDVIVNTENLPICTTTAYNYINNHVIPGVSNLDLKRKVRYAKRKGKKPKTTNMNYKWDQGRKYEDFTKFLENADTDVNIWEMDTVEGIKGTDEKCVLTLLHRRSNLQLYFLLNCKTQLEVIKVFDSIKTFLGPKLFASTFTVILTDRGVEFQDPLTLETNADNGETLIKIFYCNPRHSEEKGKCEKNHEHFREHVPKGFSMNPLTKKDIDFISNNVNNYNRRMFGYGSPYQIASLMLDPKVLKLNRLRHIEPGKVKMKRILTKEGNVIYDK